MEEADAHDLLVVGVLLVEEEVELKRPALLSLLLLEAPCHGKAFYSAELVHMELLQLQGTSEARNCGFLVVGREMEDHHQSLLGRLDGFLEKISVGSEVRSLILWMEKVAMMAFYQAV